MDFGVEFQKSLRYYVHQFSDKIQLWIFGSKFAQRYIFGSEFQKSKSEFRINTSKIPCVLIFSQNGQLLIFRPKFGEIAQLRAIFWLKYCWGCCRELGGGWNELGGGGCTVTKVWRFESLGTYFIGENFIAKSENFFLNFATSSYCMFPLTKMSPANTFISNDNLEIKMEYKTREKTSSGKVAILFYFIIFIHSLLFFFKLVSFRRRKFTCPYFLPKIIPSRSNAESEKVFERHFGKRLSEILPRF